MEDNINPLFEKLEVLLKKQELFQKEIAELKTEITNLKHLQGSEQKESVPVYQIIADPKTELSKDSIDPSQQIQHQSKTIKTQVPKAPKKKRSFTVKSNVEKFIGENLINKIGIIILVIGVTIGAKYVIDHQLISPLTRIILGYFVGLILLGFAIKLKRKFEPFSAVLLSGSIAILYFITFIAFSFYNLFPQAFAFILMIIFTVFSVIAAINYNRQVIAHIGLVGAYAIPFLLSNDTDNIPFLLSYIAIINTGILVIAFKKYWKPLYYSSFAITWLIFLSWYSFDYNMGEHLGLALTFLSIFFVIFYLTFLSYKVIGQEKFRIDDILLLLANSFIFYAFGYSIISGLYNGDQLLGLFTLANGIIHFAVSVIIYRKKLVDKNILYFITGLVLIFITITFPIQLDGNWVTLLWAGEAALLFWIGRTKNSPIYEILSYPIMILALFSIFQDWTAVYLYSSDSAESTISPIFNIHFLTSILFVASFVIINLINYKKKYLPQTDFHKTLLNIMGIIIPSILLTVLYFSFRMEILSYFKQLYISSAVEITTNGDYGYTNHDHNLRSFKSIWIINYSLLFFSIISFLNIKILKNKLFGFINLGINALCIVVFLIQGLWLLSELRDSYLSQYLSEYYHRGIFLILIRYISFIFFALIMYASYKYIKQSFLKSNLRIVFDYVLYVSILWIISSELIHWLDISKSADSYKLGLSILWGLYSLVLIVIGIWKKKKYLRIGAISLFGFTLLKLFFYDMSHLSTISKTIVFISLGVLLLIISFLYNKYKQMIFDETES